MNSAEYDNLAALEREHWYYAGKRDVVRHWLTTTGALSPDRVLLDCGAGTGLFAKEMEAHCRVLVLDDHEESLRILRTRFRSDQILQLSGDRVPLPDGSLDCVTALDVLEHVSDDTAVVQGFQRLLKPGGIAVVTVPAGMELWSDWDEALHHFRRYDRAGLGALFPAAQWDVVYLNYTNVVVYPAVWCIRRWRAWRKQRGAAATATRTEDKLPPRPVNRLLRVIYAHMARWRIRFPFGVSLLLVARRI